MKWGTKYGAEYVNNLYHGLARHTTQPFQLICLTEIAEGIHPDVLIRPLPSTDLDTASMDAKKGGDTWRKVMLFLPNIIGEENRERDILFLDLDVAIMGDVDRLFAYHPGEFCVIHDWLEKRRGKSGGNTSVIRFKPSVHQKIYHYYREHQAEMLEKFRIEQQYVTWAAGQLCGAVHYWQENWTQSYKRSCRRMFPLNYLLEPNQPLADCSILVFHGYPTPAQALHGYGSLWKKCLPTQWLAKHWQEGA